MITFLIVYINFLTIAVFMYLVIIGSSKLKTKEEQQLEDEEQMKYLKEYENRRKRKCLKCRKY